MAAPAPTAAAFTPLKRLVGLEKLPEAERALLEQLNAIRLDLARLQAPPAVTEVKTSNYLAGEDEVVRVAPAANMTLLLPQPRIENRGRRVTVLLESVARGSLTIQCVGGLVDGQASETVSLVCRLDFVCDGVAGWRSIAVGPQFLGDIDSASVIYDTASHTLQRAALTGEATASQNSNAVTVTRSTNYQSSPWTGNHQFNGEIRGGTLTTSSSTGSVNITLDSGSTRLVLTGASLTLGTISGCADGRILVVEHTGTGLLRITHDSTSANAIACPGDTDLMIPGRGGVVLVGRQGTNANWKVFAVRGQTFFPTAASDTTSTGTIATYTLAESTDIVRFQSGIAATTLRGATIPAAEGHAVIWDNNDDTGVNVTFNHEDGSAAAAGNRFRCPGGANYVLAPGHRIVTCYYGSRHRVVATA